MDIQHIKLSGQPFVILPKKDYEHMLELAEYADDLATMERIMTAYDPNDETFPADFVYELCDARDATQPLVPIWRKYRGLTQAALAKKAGVTQAYISDIESGKKDGSISVMKKIATILKCDLDDLV